MNPHAETFANYYGGSDDPWSCRTRWYERRKRELLLAMLPRERFGAGWEMACSNGELAAALAPRCTTLLATDGNARAVELSKERLRIFPGAVVEERWLPGDWPGGSFDLVVFSEMGYYLDGDALSATCRRLRYTVRAGGTLIAVHWRRDIAGCQLNGEAVHRMLASELPWRRLARHEEKDFLMDLWTTDGLSVAEEEGLP